jgi:hypothetical protein
VKGPRVLHKPQKRQPVAAFPTVLVFPDEDLVDRPHELHLLKTYSCGSRQSKEDRIERSEVNLAEIAKDQRQIPEYSQLGVGMPSARCVIYLFRQVSALHAWRGVTNIERLAADWTM